MDKLARIVGNEAIAARLKKEGLEYPTDIRKASDLQLKHAGLSDTEIAKVRTKLPRVK